MLGGAEAIVVTATVVPSGVGRNPVGAAVSLLDETEQGVVWCHEQHRVAITALEGVVCRENDGASSRVP